MKTTIGKIIALFSAVTFSACSASPGLGQPVQIIVALPRETGAHSQTINDSLVRLVGQLPALSQVRIIDGNAQTNVASFAVPKLNYPSPAALKGRLNAVFHRPWEVFCGGLKQSQAAGLNFPALLRQLSAEQCASAETYIIVIGNAYWEIPDAGWRGRESKMTPSDGCLIKDPVNCPVGLGGFTNRLQGVRVLVVPLGAYTTVEFEALRQLHAKIVGVTGAQLSAFDPDVAKTLSLENLRQRPRPLPVGELTPGDCRMLLITKPPPPPARPGTNIDLSGQTNLVIQAKWAADGPVDIDLTLLPGPGVAAVNWQNKAGANGILHVFDDLRGGHGPQAEHLVMPATVDLSSARLFLNCFEGNLTRPLPVEVELRHLGVTTRAIVMLPPCRGNRGGGWTANGPAAGAPAWIEIPKGLLGL